MTTTAQRISAYMEKLVNEKSTCGISFDEGMRIGELEGKRKQLLGLINYANGHWGDTVEKELTLRLEIVSEELTALLSASDGGKDE